MFGLSTFRESLREIGKNKIDYFFLFFQFLYFARLIRQTHTDSYLVLHLAITFIFVLARAKTSVDIRFLYVILGYAILSVIPSVVFGFNIPLFIGYLFRLTIAYLIIVYFGMRFTFYLENLVFVLAFISIPLFILQVLLPDFFNIFSGISNSVLQLHGLGHGSEYLFIFFRNGSAIMRNSGFMSEPSSYSAILTWAILINLFYNDFKDNVKLRVLYLVLLTTFSIGGLIYASLIGLIYLIKNSKGRFVGYFARVALVFILLFPIVIEMDFVQDNIEMIAWKLGSEERIHQNVLNKQAGVTEVSRVSGAIINLNYFAEWPLGYGLDKPEDPHYKYLGASPNGLARLMVTWGIGFLVLLAISSTRFVKIMETLLPDNGITNKGLARILILVTFVIPLSGYSFFNQPLMLAIFIWPILMYSDWMRHLRNLRLSKAL